MVGGPPGYGTVHARLVRERGSAKAHACTRCGAQAMQWAYVGPRVGGERKPFSADLDLYEPMCVKCHKEHDAALIKVTDRHPGDETLF